MSPTWEECPVVPSSRLLYSLKNQFLERCTFVDVIYVQTATVQLEK